MVIPRTSTHFYPTVCDVQEERSIDDDDDDDEESLTASLIFLIEKYWLKVAVAFR